MIRGNLEGNMQLLLRSKHNDDDDDDDDDDDEKRILQNDFTDLQWPSDGRANPVTNKLKIFKLWQGIMIMWLMMKLNLSELGLNILRL